MCALFCCYLYTAAVLHVNVPVSNPLVKFILKLISEVDVKLKQHRLGARPAAMQISVMCPSASRSAPEAELEGDAGNCS